VKKNPDIILFLPCGFDIERTRNEMEPFAQRKDWFDLKAVQNNRVFLLDGNHYFNRPGPRLVESLEILAEIFHPDDFDFGHKNDGWQYWGFNRF
jgi:iron complex transport system substrate-binding protein